MLMFRFSAVVFIIQRRRFSAVLLTMVKVRRTERSNLFISTIHWNSSALIILFGDIYCFIPQSGEGVEGTIPPTFSTDRKIIGKDSAV